VKRDGFWRFKRSGDASAQKKAMLIFVEGTRRMDNEPSQAQPGIGFLAVKASAQVIPVYVDGTQKVMPPGPNFHPHR